MWQISQSLLYMKFAHLQRLTHIQVYIGHGAFVQHRQDADMGRVVTCGYLPLALGLEAGQAPELGPRYTRVRATLGRVSFGRASFGRVS